MMGTTRRRTNLVYVFADQLRYQSMGYAGDGKAVTPHIDRFAGEGVNFTNAVASSPVCTAYRASLLTGKYTTSHGMVINELRMNPHQRCFGHVLTDAGYRTAYLGKWHLYANQLGHHDDPKNSFVPRGPHRLGFDGEWKAYNFHHQNYGTYYHAETPQKIFYGEGVYEPDAQTDFAIDFVRRASSDNLEPFALFLSWGPPHDPWGPDNVPAAFWDLYRDTAFLNPPNYLPHNDTPYADDWATLGAHDRAQLESWRRGYYAQLTSVDANFGRLLRALDESGAADDTLVVFTSDHGEMFGAHGRRAKNIFYEEACHVPLLMRRPGRIPAGHASDACLSTVDLMPTLLALMELECPGVEGMDLSHCACGWPGSEPDAALMQICGATAAWEDGHEWRALRDKRYTYAVYRVDGKELLFDNQADPFQMHNLAGDLGLADTQERFRLALAAKMASLNDGFESCTWYRDHWTDDQRNIIRSATCDFAVGNEEHLS